MNCAAVHTEYQVNLIAFNEKFKQNERQNDGIMIFPLLLKFKGTSTIAIPIDGKQFIRKGKQSNGIMALN